MHHTSPISAAKLGVSAFAVMMALTACGSGAGGGSGSPAGSGGNLITPTVLKLSRSAAQIQQYAPAHFSDYYAGVAITANRRGLDVYRRPGSVLDSRLQALVHGVSLTFHDSRHSKTQLDQLATRVTADIPYWASQHVTITGVNPASIDGSAVQIEVTNPKKAQAALQNRYGPDSVHVVKTEPTKPQFANR